jgi:septal ring-binding cell division protein DamX
VAAAPPPARPAAIAPAAPDLSGDPAYASALERLDQDDAAGAALLFRDLLGSRPASAVALQLMIACQEETVKGARRRAGVQGGLFILPYSLRGRPCYRVLWGLYENADAARAAVPSLPAGLIQGTDPIAVSLARLLPPG